MSRANRCDNMAREAIPVLRQVALREASRLRLDATDLESLGNEALVRLIKKYDGSIPWRAFLRVQLRWAMLESLRCHVRRRTIVERFPTAIEDHFAVDNHEDRLTWQKLTAALGRAMEDMHPAHRQLLHELYFDERSQGEVAREIGVSHDAICRRHAAALRKLRMLVVREMTRRPAPSTQRVEVSA